MPEQEWYWCLDHGVAVTADDPCPPKRKLGPYPSRRGGELEADRRARNEQWDAEDKEWSGDD